MIKIHQEEIFDLNKVGLILTVLIGFFMLLNPIQWTYLLVLELVLLGYGFYLLKTIKNNKNVAIFINKENKWFVEKDGKMQHIILKDFWFLNQLIFLWVKGKKNSVSFVVTRSIIGAEKFSQLRALIK
ncbi:MAG: hypothetical protein AB8B80_04700 [Marinicellaceae bacterium]